VKPKLHKLSNLSPLEKSYHLFVKAGRGRTALACGVMAIAFSVGGLFAFFGLHKSAPENNVALAELEVAKQQSEVCSSRNAQGVGLRGEYFSEANFKGKLLLTRVDSTVDFTKELEWPVGLANSKPRSVRWSGWIRPPLSGHYAFHAYNPSAQITVGKEPVLGGGALLGKKIELAAGRYYQVLIEVPEMDAPSNDGMIKFEWTAPHGMRYVVPRALMFLPSDQVTK
jgi:hypothetical protein